MNTTRFTFCILLAALVWAAGCASRTPDPLVGWKVDFDHQPDQAIVKDYQDFIQKLPAKERDYVGTTDFVEDGTGQHAVSIEVFSNHTNAAWRYALIYNKENKRIKVIKYGFRRFMS
jgi:hypothetical protein